jgi:hypothetical protein
MVLERIYRFIESIHVYIENFLFASRYFINNNNQIISFEITGNELKQYLDTQSDLSSFINVAKYSNLDFYDTFIADDDNFWLSTVSSHGKTLRTTLKMAWLTKSITENDLKNPLQLLQSGPGKYICHPGSSRVLILTEIFPEKKIKCFYVWNELLDKNPFMLDYPNTRINNVFSFLSMFKKTFRFRVKTQILKSTQTYTGYFKYVYESLKKSHNEFYLNFITFSDSGHWADEIRGKLFFRDLISFPDADTCIFGGVKLVQHNNIWKTE